MNRKLYKTEKLKSGRPRCPYRAAAASENISRYIDAQGIERWTSSGNQTASKREWETRKRRLQGAQPQQKALAEVISRKNVANVKRWREQNPTKLSAQRAKHNYIRRSSVRERTLEPVTAKFLGAQRRLQNDFCAYCGTSLYGRGHQDHVVPVARGGAHAPSNIVWACEPCNLRKGAKLGWVPFWSFVK